MTIAVRTLVGTTTLALTLAVASSAEAQPKKPPRPADPPPEALQDDDIEGEANALQQRLRVLMSRPAGITAEEVGRRAGAASVNVRVKQAEVAAAAADVDKALVAFFPRLTLTGRYTRLSPIDQNPLFPDGTNLVVTQGPTPNPIPPGTPLFAVPGSQFALPVVLDQWMLQANLVVPLSDYVLRINQAHSAASHAHGAAETNARATRLAASAEAKLIYYNWARARLQQEVAQQNLTQAQARLKFAREQADVERISKADVLRAESLVANAELFVERAKNLTVVSEDRLRTLLRDPADKKYAIGEDLLAPASAGLERTDVATLVAEGQRKRLEFRAIERSQRALRHQKKAATASAFPRLDAFGNAYYANPNPRYFPQQKEWKATWDVGVQLTWVPNEIGTSSAAAAGLEAQHEKLAAQKSQLNDALRAEIVEAVNAAKEAQVAIQTSERSLKAAEEAYRVRMLQFRAGRTTSVELNDAETELLRARLETINSRVALRMARVKLEHATGRDVGSR